MCRRISGIAAISRRLAPAPAETGSRRRTAAGAQNRRSRARPPSWRDSPAGSLETPFLRDSRARYVMAIGISPPACRTPSWASTWLSPFEIERKRRKDSISLFRRWIMPDYDTDAEGISYIGLRSFCTCVGLVARLEHEMIPRLSRWGPRKEFKETSSSETILFIMPS